MDRKVEQIIQHPLTLLATALLIGLFCLSLIESRQKTRISEESIRELQKSVDQLDQEVNLQARQVEQSQSQLYKDKIIRNELLQKKEGEIVLQIPEEALIGTIELESKNESLQPLTAWKNLIFN